MAVRRFLRVASRACRLIAAGLGLALLVSGPALGGPTVVLHLEPATVRAGGVARLRIVAPKSVRLGTLQMGTRVIALPEPDARVLWLGVDLEARPGALLLRLEAEDAGGRLTVEGRLQVLEGKYPVQRLTLPRTFVELDPPTLERVAAERARLDALWDHMSPRSWRGAFRLPLDGAGPAAGFGARRIINGESRAPHTGVDFPAAAGTPVLAANAGRVALVADMFFSGRTVVLDHGDGLFTMYFHLQDTVVQPGREVKRGEALGHVGSTGRASGPHLHWGARLTGARIDPNALLKID